MLTIMKNFFAVYHISFEIKFLHNSTTIVQKAFVLTVENQQIKRMKNTFSET